jgi:hypothetical protein
MSYTLDSPSGASLYYITAEFLLEKYQVTAKRTEFDVCT